MLNSKYKIIAFICCAFVCAFLGISLDQEDTYAATYVALTQDIFHPSTNLYFSVSNTTSNVIHTSDDTIYLFDSSKNTYYFIFLGSNPSYDVYSYRVDDSGVASETLNYSRSYSNSGGLPVGTVSIGGVTKKYIANGFSASSANSLPSFLFSPSLDKFVVGSLNDFKVNPDNYLPSESSLDENLGVLNASIRQLNITGNNNQVHNQIYRVNWDSKSSTGFDVTQSGIKIDLKAKLSYSPSNSNGSVSYMKDYDSVLGSSQTFDFDYNQLMQYGENVISAWRNDSVFSRGSLSRRFYLRINDTNSNTVGHWIEVYPIVDGQDFLPGDRGHGGNSVVDIDDDGNVTVVEHLPDIDVDYGSGETPDDASNNADKNQQIVVPSPDDFDDIDFSGIVGSIKGALSSFISTVSSFISLVSATLGFLPKWVLNFFALSIAIWCIMLVKRAIF